MAFGAPSRVSARAPSGPTTCRISSSNSGSGGRRLRPVSVGSKRSAPGAAMEPSALSAGRSAHRPGAVLPAPPCEVRDSESSLQPPPVPPKCRVSAAREFDPNCRPL